MVSLLSLLLLGWGAGALPEVVKLGREEEEGAVHRACTGALFDEGAEAQMAAFTHSIEMVNDDRTTMSRSLLTETLATYPTDDSFKASRKLCDLVERGVAALFGPISPISANHVQSVSEALHLPYMQTRWGPPGDRAGTKDIWWRQT